MTATEGAPLFEQIHRVQYDILLTAVFGIKWVNLQCWSDVGPDSGSALLCVQ